MALRTSSLSCWSRLPSVSAWSTMPISSSSVMPSSSWCRSSTRSSFFHWVNRKFTGVSTTAITHSSGVATMAQASGRSLARLLGVTSPKIRITMVSTVADTVGPFPGPMSWINSTAPMVVATLLTMLLPMRRVESSRSKSAARARVRAARLSPSSARVFRRMRFRDVKAVSVAEK